jgi:hypothetical protein
MPPTPQAVVFVLTELWSPEQVETLFCSHFPPGFPLAYLRALLTSPPLAYTPYHDHLVDVATNLVLAGHQRSPQQVLEEMGYLPVAGPLPQIQVLIFLIYLENFYFCHSLVLYFRHSSS